MLLLDPRKWSREPPEGSEGERTGIKTLSLSPAYAVPRELEQSRFWFRRTEVRLRLLVMSSM